jgi:hypothetical protein
MVRPSQSDRSPRYWLYVTGTIAAVFLSVTLARLLMLVLPILVPLVGGGWLWRRYQTQRQQHQDRLDRVFYEGLRQHQGRMMVLDFAIATQLSAIEAQQYLDAKAREFAARYEVTQTGDIFYVFPTLQLPMSEFQDDVTALQDGVTVAEGDRGPMTQTQLAKRLGVVPDTIRRRKALPDWPTWSQAKDPAGIAWVYRPEQQRFEPAAVQPAKMQNVEPSAL